MYHPIQKVKLLVLYFTCQEETLDFLSLLIWTTNLNVYIT